jgi:hypothetical protein
MGELLRNCSVELPYRGLVAGARGQVQMKGKLYFVDGALPHWVESRQTNKPSSLTGQGRQTLLLPDIPVPMSHG